MIYRETRYSGLLNKLLKDTHEDNIFTPNPGTFN